MFLIWFILNVAGSRQGSVRSVGSSGLWDTKLQWAGWHWHSLRVNTSCILYPLVHSGPALMWMPHSGALTREVHSTQSSLSCVICHKVSLGEESHHSLLCVHNIICTWWLEGRVDIPIICYLLHTQLVLSGKSTSSAESLFPPVKLLKPIRNSMITADATPRGVLYHGECSTGLHRL